MALKVKILRLLLINRNYSKWSKKKKKTKEKKMKVLVEETKGEGLEKLLGKRVTLFCINYIYTGKLVGVNDTCVKLEDPAIVYETGKFEDKQWGDCQSLCVDTWYVQTGAIESFGVMK